LRNEGHETGRGENKADIDLRPFLGGEEYRDEGAETGLHVGNEEDEPIEAAQAASRRRQRRLGGVGPLARRWGGRAYATALPIMTVAEAV
jgi:hypothetical protein